MNPLRFITRPVKNLADAVLMPLKALWVIGLTGAINAMTYHGQWWFKWVAFGMGIAVLLAWARAARTLLVLALVAWVGMKIYRRYGAQARQQFDDWVARTQPQAAQVLQALRAPGAGASAGPGAA
jgi:hypothetical protein